MSDVGKYSGCVVAMVGKQCFGMATDRRFGQDSRTIGENFPKIFNMGPHLYVALVGLHTDILTVCDRLRIRKQAYELNRNHLISPKALSELLSQLLYEYRFAQFFVQSLVAGLDPDTFEPHIFWLDPIGYCEESNCYVTAGTSTRKLRGMCEQRWVPDLNAEHLYDLLSPIVINAMNRDAFSGLGCSIYIVEKNKVTERLLETRRD